MRGLMGERPLLVTSCLQHAANYHADTEIVSRSVEGPIHRYTYAEAERGARRLAKALSRLGIGIGVAVNRPFDAAADDLDIGMVVRGMLEA